jgi:hypothetical protein
MESEDWISLHSAQAGSEIQSVQPPSGVRAMTPDHGHDIDFALFPCILDIALP